MHTFLIEAVPARTLCSLAEAFSVLLPVIVEDVMLPGHIEHLSRMASFKDLIQCVELLRLGKVSEVAGVQPKGRSFGQRVDLGHRLSQGSRDVLVGFLIESNMTVADLDKTQIGSGGSARRIGSLVESLRSENTAGHGPEHAGSSPSHAFEEPAAVDAVLVVIVCDDVGH